MVALWTSLSGGPAKMITRVETKTAVLAPPIRTMDGTTMAALENGSTYVSMHHWRLLLPVEPRIKIS